MSVSFPAAVPNYPDTQGNDTLVNAGGGYGLSQLLDDHSLDVQAISTKVGTGSSLPTAGTILRATASGVSGWSKLNMATDVSTFDSNTLRGLITDETGTGVAVFANGATLSSPTINTPTILTPSINSFTNATHSHTNAAGGGTLTGSALQAETVTKSNLEKAHANCLFFSTYGASSGQLVYGQAWAAFDASETVNNVGILAVNVGSGNPYLRTARDGNYLVTMQLTCIDNGGLSSTNILTWFRFQILGGGSAALVRSRDNTFNPYNTTTFTWQGFLPVNTAISADWYSSGGAVRFGCPDIVSGWDSAQWRRTFGTYLSVVEIR